METNTTPAPKIRWELFNGYINYLAGYLIGEEGSNHSYAIKITRPADRTIYRVIGPNFFKLDCMDLEYAKLVAEEREANK